jgi:prepilin-type N-terminal cleavage/methylation domain-containing protein
MLSRRDDGFTLIEMLVAIVIIALIMVLLAEVILGYLRNTDVTTARLAESHDQQIAAAYWQQDVSSVGVRSSYDSTSHSFPMVQSVNNPTFPCASGGTRLVVLSWNQYDSSGTAIVISVAYAQDGTQLVRTHCKSSTVDSTVVLAHNLVSASASCTSSRCDLTIDDQSYSVTLTGQRRQT